MAFDFALHHQICSNSYLEFLSGTVVTGQCGNGAG